MKNKFYFFLIFLLGLLFVFIGILAFSFSSYFMYMIVVFLGLFILVDTLFCLVRLFQGNKHDLIQTFMRIGFGLGFLLFPQLPLSLVVVLFALYICMTGFSYLITYCYYRKERVNGRLVFLIASVVLLVVGITFILSPGIHAIEMTYIFAVYTIYLGMKYIGRAIRELLSEDRKNTLKRRIRVSMPNFIAALLPRLFIEYINEQLEVKDESIQYKGKSDLEVLIHVSKEGFGAIGHVDICYQGEVIAYGAYDEASTQLFGAIGDGVLFTVEKETYITFCCQDDSTSHIFGYSLYLDEIQKQRIEETISTFKDNLVSWNPPCQLNKDADDYASRLYKATQASFYKFKKGRFKYYFVMTNNCVLLADHIIGKSGIDIVNMNGIITPGTYFSYFEEEAKKENSRVLLKTLYR